MTALPGEVPGTQEPVYLFYSNDAGTLLYPVAPSTPLPVTSSAAPGSVQAVEGVLSTTVTNTQVTVPATANGILLLAANPARLGAIISLMRMQFQFTGLLLVSGLLQATAEKS